MSFRQTLFLGASVRYFNASVGWNGQTSSLTVGVANDTSTATTKYYWSEATTGTINVFDTAQSTTAADEFSPPAIGSPVWFQYEDFKFGGILQSWIEKKSPQGYPVYEIIVNDPREILEGTQVILNGYNQSVGSIDNLVNVYGYLESASFGASRANSAGIPWLSVKAGFLALTSSVPAIITGYSSSRLRLAGYDYIVDLSNVPSAPDFYRIPGDNATFMELISGLYADSGCDFFVRLEFEDGLNVIKFYTVSRQLQPTLTQIRDFNDSRTDVMVKERGLELRNETTSSFVVGGQLTDLYKSTLSINSNGSLAVADEEMTIWPYWGLDANGNAIIAEGVNDYHTFYLDSRGVSCPGVGAVYKCSVAELRAALVNQDVWELFVKNEWDYIDGDWKQDKREKLGLSNTYQLSDKETLNTLAKGALVQGALANLSKDAIDYYNDKNKAFNINHLYEFVRSIAQEFYGKKFMVRVPDVEVKREEDTLNIIMTHQPANSAYLSRADWLTGALPLDLPEIYHPLFQDDEGKFVPFVKFPQANKYDLSELNPYDFVVADNNLFVKCSVEPYYVFTNASEFTSPRAIINLPSPIFIRQDSGEPPVMEVMKILVKAIKISNAKNGDGITGTTQAELDAAHNTLTPEELAKLKECCDKTSGFKANMMMAPFVVSPFFAAVPLVSNVRTYGPWFAAGISGKVRYVKDTTLVPWNFNGYTYMDYAGNAQVVSSITNQQIAEMGSLQLPGAPIVQLGDALVAGGPNVTSLDVSVGTEGVVTNYRMRTYTPTFGTFTKNNADKFQRQARTAIDIKKNISGNARFAVSRQAVASRESFFLTERGPRPLSAKTPHPIIWAQSFHDASGEFHTSVSVATPEDIALNLAPPSSGDDSTIPIYSRNAMVGLEGLFRPFSLENNSETNDTIEIAHIEVPYATGQFFNVYEFMPYSGSNKSHWNPATGCLTDVYFLTGGNEYPKDGPISTIRKTDDDDDTDVDFDFKRVRTIGLAGPTFMCGWGYDLWNRPVPNKSQYEKELTDASPDGTAPNIEVFLPNLNSHEFYPNFRKRADKFKTGPIDLRWDDITKMWTHPNKMVIVEMVSPTGAKLMYINASGVLTNARFGEIKNDNDDEGNIRPEIDGIPNVDDDIILPIHNFLGGTPVASGARVIAAWIDGYLTMVVPE